MRYSNRAYLRDMDDQKIRNFLNQVYGITHHPYYSTDPSNWERMRVRDDQAPNQPHIQLWKKGIGASNKIIGLAVYDEHRNKYSYLVDPIFGEEIEWSICEWVEAQHSAVKNGNKKKIINCSACEKNA